MRFFLLGILVFCSVSNACAQEILRGKGQVMFVSEAPLETIRAETKKLNGIINYSKKNFAFKLNVASFDGFNSALQKEHFNEHYLETATYPDAIFTGKILPDKDCSKDCVTTAVCKGKFIIHGVTQIVTIPVSLRYENNVLYISGQFTILLSDYNIKIPRIVQAKIAPEIDVNVEIEMKPKK